MRIGINVGLTLIWRTWVDPENYVTGVLLPVFLSHQQISQRDVRTFLGKHLDPKGSNCFLRGSLSVVLRKPISTCYSPGPVPPLLQLMDYYIFHEQAHISTKVSSSFSLQLCQSCASILGGVSAISLKSLIS